MKNNKLFAGSTLPLLLFLVILVAVFAVYRSSSQEDQDQSPMQQWIQAQQNPQNLTLEDMLRILNAIAIENMNLRNDHLKLQQQLTAALENQAKLLEKANEESAATRKALEAKLDGVNTRLDKNHQKLVDLDPSSWEYGCAHLHLVSKKWNFFSFNFLHSNIPQGWQGISIEGSGDSRTFVCRKRK